MTPAEVLKRVISKLDELAIPYMVAGSFAGSAYGLLRSTFDADLIVDLRRQHISGFVAEFAKDFYVDAGQVEQAVAGKSSFNLIHLGIFFKVDVFVLGDAAFAREEFSRRVLRPSGNAEVGAFSVATPEDVILSKVRWYRDGGEVSGQQWRDVIAILKAQGTHLDLSYMRRWAQELSVSDVLARQRRGGRSGKLTSRPAQPAVPIEITFPAPAGRCACGRRSSKRGPPHRVPPTQSLSSRSLPARPGLPPS
jgi:hypothetical protein